MKEPSSRLRAILLGLASERGIEGTFCPSEAARRLDPKDWRRHMQAVREAAVDLAVEGTLVVFQKGAPVDPATVRGPIRLGIPRGSEAVGSPPRQCGWTASDGNVDKPRKGHTEVRNPGCQGKVFGTQGEPAVFVGRTSGGLEKLEPH